MICCNSYKQVKQLVIEADMLLGGGANLDILIEKLNSESFQNPKKYKDGFAQTRCSSSSIQ